MSKPDMLIFMTDQHTPLFSSFAGGEARTLHMEKLCQDGTNFTAAYTSCPLCVPARVSMLMGKLPSRTGVFDNNGAIPDTSATFLHSLVSAGYETVLIGRMHFVGQDQRHGFTKRFVGDMTPVSWNRPGEKLRAERGVHIGYAEPICLTNMGGGDSPVLEYDKEVVRNALDYLSGTHDKPQCIFVGTYGPHFPYVAPVDKYLYYKDRIKAPDTSRDIPAYLNPVLASKVQEADEETYIRARAAYYGMIETIDEQMGSIRDAFDGYTSRNGRDGIFTYLSDHGDQCGEKGLYGKSTYFESSARIPFIVQGKGIQQGNQVNTPTSIMDLGPTLCAFAGVIPPPGQDGISLVPELCGEERDTDRYVLSEFMNTTYPQFPGSMAEVMRARMSGKLSDKNAVYVPSKMVRKGKYKYVTYIGYEQYDMLFDLCANPGETQNIADRCLDILQELRSIAYKDWDHNRITKSHGDYMENIRLITAWEKAVGPDDTERWDRNPEYARVLPKVT